MMNFAKKIKFATGVEIGQIYVQLMKQKKEGLSNITDKIVKN
jgi:hypothetical protein